MQRAKIILAIGLIVPVLSLLSLTAIKYYQYNYGREVILPISGYDPRDLLYGNYLVYSIDYGIPDMCLERINLANSEAYVCLEPKNFSYSEPQNCALLIAGSCKYGRFIAGIERFYASEHSAKELENLVRDHKANVALAVNGSGHAMVKYLLVNGKLWKPN